MELPKVVENLDLEAFVRRTETRFGGVLLVIVAAGWFFAELAEEVGERETMAFDRAVLLLFRDGNNHADIVGPPWVGDTVADLTALGGFPLAFLISLLVIGFLLLICHYRHAVQVFLSIAGGTVLVVVLKNTFMRPRPTIVPSMYELESWSFPSGHATTAAVVYLTLGILIARFVSRRRLALYALGTAFFLTVLVGLTRVALGVHYPTDVLGGWTIGLSWALFCWLAINVWEKWQEEAGAE